MKEIFRKTYSSR